MTQTVRRPAAVRETLPSTLGAVGLALGVVSALGMLFGATMVASLAAQIAEGIAEGTIEPGALPGQSFWMFLVSMAGGLGSVAMAVSIVAIALDRGRRMAIGGVILAIITVLLQANAVFVI